MLRLVALRYRRSLLVVAALLGLLHLSAILIYDLGWTGLRTPVIDGVMTMIGVGLFTLTPFAFCCDLGRHPRDLSRYARPRAAWYLGGALGALMGLVSGLFGLAQAGLRHFLLGEPETITGLYLGMLLLGQIMVLWVGGFMGWVGYLAGSRFHDSSKGTANP